jgi:predicted metalloprotease with PDZ domain
MLGAMLDLKIRHESGNRQSLDDAMRALYREYYQQKRRGFTDAEFRAACERAAGTSLEEVFSYASTTRDPDYARYFAYAGLALDATSADGKGAFLGLNTHVEDSKLLVVAAQAGSPAEKEGLRGGDRITEIDGAKATQKALSDALAARKPGDRLKLGYMRGDEIGAIEPVLATNPVRTYRFRKVEQPDALASEIWKSWMRAQQ